MRVPLVHLSWLPSVMIPEWTSWNNTLMLLSQFQGLGCRVLCVGGWRGRRGWGGGGGRGEECEFVPRNHTEPLQKLTHALYTIIILYIDPFPHQTTSLSPHMLLSAGSSSIREEGMFCSWFPFSLLRVCNNTMQQQTSWSGCITSILQLSVLSSSTYLFITSFHLYIYLSVQSTYTFIYSCVYPSLEITAL